MYFFDLPREFIPTSLEIEDKLSSSLDFDRILVVKNPVSTNEQRASKSIDSLREIYGNILEVFETGENEKETEDALYEALRPGDIVPIAGGDGTANWFVKALSNHPEADKIKDIRMVPLRGGDANDLALQFNSLWYHRNINKILKHGQAISFRPLEIQVITPSKEQILYIASYVASFGWVALSAQYLNDPENRRFMSSKTETKSHDKSRFAELRQDIAEAKLIDKARRNSQLFGIEEEGQKRQSFELLFANGDRAAKYGRFPVKLTDVFIHQMEIDDKRWRNLAPVLAKFVLRRKLPGFAREEVSFFINSEDDNSVLSAQFDGEDELIPSGSEVKIRQSRQSIQAITTRKKLISPKL